MKWRVKYGSEARVKALRLQRCRYLTGFLTWSLFLFSERFFCQPDGLKSQESVESRDCFRRLSLGRKRQGSRQR